MTQRIFLGVLQSSSESISRVIFLEHFQVYILPSLFISRIIDPSWYFTIWVPYIPYILAFSLFTVCQSENPFYIFRNTL